ncbi:MAG TPA: formylglycine-generating enzyme family protein [Xanthobacteraceae bacterium]|nr:formylglycine-generating enzyme family protein [Xanthobacteraceae bacterium]
MRYQIAFSTTWALGAVLAAALAGGVAAEPAPQGLSDQSVAGAVHLAEAQLQSDPAAVAQAETPSASSAPGTTFRDCAECPEMVVVPAGKFMMGSEDGADDEKPVHEVVIAKPFAVGKFEVTFDEYDACAAGGGCVNHQHPSDAGWGRGRHPVIAIPWMWVSGYLDWLSQKTGKRYRLLTEAEWEYAARAGTTTKYAFGDTITHDQANFSAGTRGQGRTVEVGSYPPNAWGLYDMHGNVWEWVEDCYEVDYEKAPADGSAYVYPSCPTRVARGGSWDYEADDLRSSLRYAVRPYYGVDEIGFRVARSLE